MHTDNLTEINNEFDAYCARVSCCTWFAVVIVAVANVFVYYSA